jgi:hypothetical protein
VTSDGLLRVSSLDLRLVTRLAQAQIPSPADSRREVPRPCRQFFMHMAGKDDVHTVLTALFST